MDYMLQQGHHISFAGNEWQCNFINNIFRGIEIIHLKGYNITYGNNLVLSILADTPRLLKTIKAEHEWLLKQTLLKKYDAIISDNRYGLWHPKIPSVIITHQLRVITGSGKYADSLFQKLHFKFLKRFNECWVPDVQSSPNLSGILGHPEIFPANTRYIGLLSQFGEIPKVENSHRGYILVLLSGPEPHRTKLSQLLWEQALQYPGEIVFVEGSHRAVKPEFIPAHIQWHAQIGRETLLPLLQNAEIVICRSGYSTLMDLVALRKKGIIIPTPGQTEQEYLGEYLNKEQIFYMVKQGGFELVKAIKESNRFPFKVIGNDTPFNAYKNAVDTLFKG
jgi:hypothetical protein